MLSSLHLLNFRSHAALELDFSARTNVIIGSNGAGKTNILEAVLMLATGKSYRGSDDEVVLYDNDFCKVSADWASKKRSLLIEKKPSHSQKSFLIAGKKVKRLSFQNRLPVVLFEPEFLQILLRGPDRRRDYLDAVLVNTSAGYQTLLSKYQRVLAQRNAALKNISNQTNQLFVWDVALSQLGALIVDARTRLLETIQHSLPEKYSSLASQDHAIGAKYHTKTNLQDYASSLLLGLKNNFLVDKQRGFTSLGPHRDDISFTINNRSASAFASRGEMRSLLLSLKIMELSLVEKARGKQPLLLLDDVFSELDDNRQTKLIEYFKHHQVIITTTTVTPLMRGFSGKIIEL